MRAIRGFIASHTLATWVACAYLFFSHMPRTTAMVNISAGLMLVLTLVLMVKCQLQIDWHSNLVRAYTVFFTVVLLGITFSPYWQESLIPLRRELLPMTLAFVLLTGQKSVRQQGEQTRVASLAGWALMAAFVLRSFLALNDWLVEGVHTDYYSSDHAAARFFDFFAIDATLIMPVVVAAILCLAMPRSLRSVLIISVLTAFLLIVVSNVRTALVTSLVVTLLQLLPRLRSRKIWAVLGIALLSLGVATVASNRFDKVVERYATIFSRAAYQGSEATGASSVYERLSIWKGTLEMAAERPLVGYGLGWQKLYDAAYQGGYVDRWRNSPAFIDKTVAHYFDTYERGKVNPHNLWVDIVFETGVLGFMSYIAMLCVLLARAFRAWRDKAQDQVTHWFVNGALAYMVTYGLVNMMGGFWLSSGATLLLFIVSELLWQKQQGTRIHRHT